MMANNNREDLQDCVGSPEFARYANYFKVSFNPIELIMDFGQFYLENTTPSVHTRIITTPVFGKAFLAVLRQSIDDFEQSLGPIADPGANAERSQ